MSLYERCKNEICAILLPRTGRLDFVSWIPQAQLVKPANGSRHRRVAGEAMVWRPRPNDISGDTELIGKPIHQPLWNALPVRDISWSNYRDAVTASNVWNQITDNLRNWHQNNSLAIDNSIFQTRNELAHAMIICSKLKIPRAPVPAGSTTSSSRSGGASSSRGGAVGSSFRGGAAGSSCRGSGAPSSSRGGAAAPSSRGSDKVMMPLRSGGKGLRSSGVPSSSGL